RDGGAHDRRAQRPEVHPGLSDGEHGGAQAGRVLLHQDLQGAPHQGRDHRDAGIVMSVSMSGTKTDKRPVVAEATLRYHRGSAQKARLVLDQIRGRNVNDALGLLRFSPKVASGPIEKLLRSAVANAERAEEKVDVDTLYVAESYAGP